jgi:hypothetical protein
MIGKGLLKILSRKGWCKDPDEVTPEELPEQTTRKLAEGKPPVVDGVPTEQKKAVLG